ncbi:RES domain-containing protein [Butyrivibrio sp. AE2032]|uniref:RES domain-containing protein n=1 Tax=Butyrivibrio sp. AE2032 TaxID=1458463 RepID=UPI0005528A8C|nr:RES domain-containing protein [Butyrivibrio sp. AE2032]
MKLTWLNNGFICKDLYAPFVLDKDIDYINDLRKRYKTVLIQAEKAGADDESIVIIKKFKAKIIDAINCYYKADLSKSSTIIRNLIRDIVDPFAVNTLLNSDAFYGNRTQELQFFRCRVGNPSNSYTAKDMLHLPKKLRSLSGNYRFSIPGNPSLYLSNSSYGCWIESGFPPATEFNVSPVVLDGTQKIFNLAVSIRDFGHLNDFEESRVHCWLKLYMLTIATSYKIREEGRTFKSEYVISQAVMMACRKLGYDGVAYYSKRVSDEVFSLCAINLALFVNYDKDYSEIVKHMKIDDAFNYFIYQQLWDSLKYKNYPLRAVSTGKITNIGNYDRQYPYRETEFINFDKFLFTTWRDKPNGRGKDQIPWGVNTN